MLLNEFSLDKMAYNLDSWLKIADIDGDPPKIEKFVRLMYARYNHVIQRKIDIKVYLV